MKKRYLFLLLFLFFLFVSASYDAPAVNTPAVEPQKVVAPIEVKPAVKVTAPAVVETNVLSSQSQVVDQQVEQVVTPKAVVEAPIVPVTQPVDVPLSNDNTYINSEGNEVHSPAYAPSVPAGASALCGDGTYSFSQNRRGTCSRHGGVAEWL